MRGWVRINLGLAVVAALLLVLDRWPGDPEATARLSSIDPSTIQQLRISRGNRLVLAFQRRDDAWQMTDPTPQAATSRRVEQLLAVARAPVLQHLGTRPDLATYGLDRPQAVIEFDTQRFAFGNLDPSQRSRYVLTADTVVTIDDVYFSLLSLPAQHFATD